MKTIVTGVTVTIDEKDGEFTACATFEGYKIIQLSATSSRDYAAVAALFDAMKRQAIENLQETSEENMIGNARMHRVGEPMGETK